jgi:tetratricopeptide (TPR) repeat protein
MKKQVVLCCVVYVVLTSSVLNVPGGNVMAQVSETIRTPLPGSFLLDDIKGPAEGILELDIRDGLKRFLLADLFAQHGQYEQALEIVDYTKPVTILDKELAVEKDPELIRLLEYQRQKIEEMVGKIVREIDLKQQADDLYEKALTYQKFEKYEQAIQALLEALSVYQLIESLEGQLLVRYQLALAYKAIGKNEEALHQAQEFLKLEQDLELVQKTEDMQELVQELEGKTTTN